MSKTFKLVDGSVGDMVALEAKYHTKCLVGLYNRARRAKAKSGLKSTGEEDIMSKIAFAELVMYIEETRYSDEDQAPAPSTSTSTSSIYIFQASYCNKLEAMYALPRGKG